MSEEAENVKKNTYFSFIRGTALLKEKTNLLTFNDKKRSLSSLYEILFTKVESKHISKRVFAFLH